MKPFSDQTVRRELGTAVIVAAFTAAYVGLIWTLVVDGLTGPLRVVGWSILLAGLFAVGRSVRSSLVVIAAAAPIFIVAGELYFRLHYFGFEAILHPRQFVPASIGDPLVAVPMDAGSFTGLKPNSSGMMKGAHFRVNNLGFRGPTVPLKKDPNVVRIAVFGTSSDMGSGVGEGLQYSSRMESLMNAGSQGRRIDVLNFAFGGYSIKDVLDVLESCALAYDPDIILVSAESFRRDGLQRKRLLRKFRGYDFRLSTKVADALRQPWKVLFFVQALRNELAVDVSVQVTSYWKQVKRGVHALLPSREKLALPGPQWEDSLSDAAALKKLGELTGSRRVYVVMLHNLSALKFQAAQAKQLQPLCRKFGIGYIVTSSADYGTNFRDLTIHVGDRHPNERAHELYAKAICKVLEPVVAEIRSNPPDEDAQ